MSEPQLQQPRIGNITRIATERDLREAATIIASQNGKTKRALDARLDRIEAKLDRIIEIMKAASAAKRTDP